MKKRYTRKQITEAIRYWKKRLGELNESSKERRIRKVQDLAKECQYLIRKGYDLSDLYLRVEDRDITIRTFDLKLEQDKSGYKGHKVVMLVNGLSEEETAYRTAVYVYSDGHEADRDRRFRDPGSRIEIRDKNADLSDLRRDYKFVYDRR